MNPNEHPKRIWTPAWPDRRTALLRLLLITCVVFPLSWAVNALLVGSWNLLVDRNAESVRHLIEWQIIWIAAVAVVFLASLLPPLRGLVSRFNGRRWFFGLVCVATLVVLFYAEENWRGARAWNNYRQQLEATGSQLDLAAFVPKPVPDEQNFAAIPFIKSWFDSEKRGQPDKLWSDSFSRASGMVRSATTKAGRTATDLAAWEMAFSAVQSGQTNQPDRFASDKLDRASRAQAAPAVLQGLKTSDAFLDELRVASRRPYSQYPVHYDLDNPWGILLPHLAVVKSVCQRLQLKACAELAAGHSEQALQDVDLMLRMADSLKSESFLISYLVRIKCVQLAVQPVWEGLVDQAWSDAQLQELQSRFQQYNLVADMKPPLELERAAAILTAELASKKGLGVLVDFVGPGQPTSMDHKVANWCGGFIPRGWYHQEQLTYCRLFQMQFEGAYDFAQKRISPERLSANTRELDREIASGSFGKTVSGFLNHRIIATLLLPALNRIPVQAATVQTAADQTALALALERFRLANRDLPEKLDALVPRFIAQLPADTLTGKPYNYHRTHDGQFVLNSVGWDQKDDGGASGTLGEVLQNLFNEKEGDWVWRYPAK